MKSFSFFLITLGASVALAFPNLNDRAEYNGRYTPAPGLGAPVDFAQSFELLAFDSIKFEYTIRVSASVAGGLPQTIDQQVPAADVPTSAQVNDILTYCTGVGGALTQVTVPAGTFDSCALPRDNGGTIWIANVPFGFAKLISIDTDGNRNEAELLNFTLGN